MIGYYDNTSLTLSLSELASICAMFEADNLEDVSFTINENYAKRFEHNKKREELHRCKYL